MSAMNNRKKGTVLFKDAVGAFEVRFERELNSRWESCEVATLAVLRREAIAEKRCALGDCFGDIAEAIAAVTHDYFPKLLEVALSFPKHLRVGGLQAEPTSWTADKIRQKVCNFLGMQADFVGAVVPSSRGLVAEATRRMLSLTGCLPEGSNDELVLPRWVDFTLDADFARLFLRDWYVSTMKDSDKSLTEFENQTMTRPETLSWIAAREREIGERLVRQLADECLDATIRAGITNSRVNHSQAPREPAKLGPKKTDLSRYLDSANLTDRQYKCLSLHYEYSLSKAEIARQLEIDRKTVDEHLAAGGKRLERQRAKLQRDKNIAKVKPGGMRT